MTITRYRKRPVEIEAVQYGLAEYADSPWVIRSDEIPQWLQDAARDGIVVPEFRSEDYWYLKIQTLEGDMYAAPDDWIIRGVKGELYPCKPDVFRATYEVVTGPPAPETTELKTTARVFAALHRSAEDTVTRVITLHEQWVKAGPPPLGTPLARWWDKRLAELHDAIVPPADQTTEK